MYDKPYIIRVAILVLLAEEAAHGYRIQAELKELGLAEHTTSGGMYRCLRAMADQELIISYWETPDRGPAKRVYEIAAPGIDFLREHIEEVKDHAIIIRKLSQRVQKVL